MSFLSRASAWRPRITHFKRLKQAEDEAGYLLRTTQVLGERLGAVLLQLPPNLKLDLARLETFLELAERAEERKESVPARKAARRREAG